MPKLRYRNRVEIVKILKPHFYFSLHNKMVCKFTNKSIIKTHQYISELRLVIISNKTPTFTQVIQFFILAINIILVRVMQKMKK